MKKNIYVIIVGAILSLVASSITATKIKFGNKTSTLLYVWPIPNNELPKMLGSLPPNSLDIRFDIPSTITSVIVMDNQMMNQFKMHAQQRIANKTCSKYDKPIDCNRKIINKTRKTHGSSYRQNAFMELNPNKNWIAFTPVGRASGKLLYGRVAFAEEI